MTVLKYAKKKFDAANIPYTIHNNKSHMKINDTTHFYPTTGKFVMGGNTYEDDWGKSGKGAKKQVKRLINMLNGPTMSMEAPNPWSTGLYVPYMVEFHFWDGWIERVKV